jgi:hypothetical protein
VILSLCTITRTVGTSSSRSRELMARMRLPSRWLAR